MPVGRSLPAKPSGSDCSLSASGQLLLADLPRLQPLLTRVAVTVAPTTIAPLSSVTIPVIVVEIVRRRRGFVVGAADDVVLTPHLGIPCEVEK
jgi:hypothetical protein